MMTKATIAVDTEVDALESLAQRAYEMSNNIWVEAGCTAKWNEAQAFHSRVRNVVGMLEEILCHALCDIDDLSEAHRSRTLMFQNI